MIFTIPDGFECESQVVDGEGTSVTVFSINNDDIGLSLIHIWTIVKGY